MRLLRRIPLLVWIILPIALLALIAWPLGGWDTVKLASRELPEYASNQVLETHRFDIRVDDAWLSTGEHPAGYAPPDDDEIFLVVRVDITNTTNEPAGASDLGDYLTPVIDGVDAGEFGVLDYVLATDGTALPELNPGLLRDMLFVYTIPRSAVQPGDDLRIDLQDGVPAKSILGYGLQWIFEPAGYAIRNVDER